MAASITDKFSKTYNAANPNVARVTSSRAAAGTSLACDNLAGWPTDTVVQFSTYKINTSNAVIAGTQIDWKGIVTGNTVGTLTRVTGASDTGSAIGDVVEMNPTATWANELVTGILAQHNQDGSHGAITGTSAVLSGAVQGATVTSTGDLKVRSVSVETIKSETTFDYIASGCVWSGDSYGSTRNASCTAGVVYIAGKRLTVAAVTARSFTASKDVYCDLKDNGDNTAVWVYFDSTTNAVSPNLATTTGAVRGAIIIVGASNIANAAAVNQGQEDRVLPIASSIPYAVTDLLGNLICPRDPQRKVLGYRQITSDFTATTATDITGLNLNCIVPAGRKVKVVGYIGAGSSSAINNGVTMILQDVTAGNQLATATGVTNPSADVAMTNPSRVYTPASTTMNYKAQLNRGSNAATAHTNSSATNPSYLQVELV